MINCRVSCIVHWLVQFIHNNILRQRFIHLHREMIEAGVHDRSLYTFRGEDPIGPIVPVPKLYLSRHAPRVCNLDAFFFIIFGSHTYHTSIPTYKIAEMSKEHEPVSTNLHLYDAPSSHWFYNCITFYFTCPVVLKWDYFSCLILSG